ncbi:MAG: RecB family exonuclease, partial [Mycobacteriales bacterium]
MSESCGRTSLAETAAELLFRATPTRLLAFADCPRRYRMAYLDRPAPQPGPQWAHNSLGSAVHTALRDFWDLARDARVPSAAGQLVTRAWSDRGFRDPAQARTWRAAAVGWVSRYLSAVDPDDEPVGVERTFGMRTSGLALSGRVDRLDDRAGELVVVDYKTGRHPP